VKSYKDLPQILCDQIAHFFQHYKDLEKGKWAKVRKWGGPQEAKKIIVAAIAAGAGKTRKKAAKRKR